MIIEAILFGLSLGTANGITPGPLWTLTVSQSLKYGFKEGMKVGFAPILSDAPIITLSLLLWNKIARFDIALAVISFIGAGFLLYLCYENFKVKPDIHTEPVSRSGSLKKGIITNYLNPAPYLFWMTVGAPKVITYWQSQPVGAVLFFAMFYLTFVGAEIIIAFLAFKSVQWLKGRVYRIMIRVIGAVLGLFGLKFIFDGLRYLGVFG